MTTSKTKFTISEAARIAGKSRTTIQAHLKAQELSCEIGKGGKKLIDASELMRVYGDECDFDRASPTLRKNESVSKQFIPRDTKEVDSQLNSVQQLLDTERKERDREREQLQSRIDFLEEAVERAQEGLNRTTLLLESRTEGVGDLEESFRKLENRIANQETEFEKKSKEMEQQVMRYKKALMAEKSKTVWQRLFG